MHIFGTADGGFLACRFTAYHVDKAMPEPKAWAGFGFWRPKARAWILLSPAQAEPGQAEPAHH